MLFIISSVNGFGRRRMNISSGHAQMGPLVVPMKVVLSQTFSHFQLAGSVVTNILNAGVEIGTVYDYGIVFIMYSMLYFVCYIPLVLNWV